MRLFKIPSVMTRLFPSVHWNFPHRKNQIFLTFDDGPDANFTPRILDILDSADVSASFFILGEKAQTSPASVKEIVGSGHTLGIHSFHHQSLLWRPKRYLREQIQRAKQMVEQISGEPIRYFRPPFGRFSPAIKHVCQEIDMQLVLWTIMSYDFDVNVSDEKILNLISTAVTGGDIIVFHDGCENSHRTVAILPQILKRLQTRGFNFAAL